MKKLLALALSLSLAVSLAACGQSTGTSSVGSQSGGSSASSSADSSTETSGDPIKIGFFAPITSASASADGESTRNSVELAAKIINDNGGINGRPVELVIYDDGLDTAQAVSIDENLTT